MKICTIWRVSTESSRTEFLMLFRCHVIQRLMIVPVISVIRQNAWHRACCEVACHPQLPADGKRREASRQGNHASGC